MAALRRLYTDLRASVELWHGKESRTFRVQRGVRQGDPLSPLLFNLVLNQVLEEAQVPWRRRGYGTNVGMTVKGDRLTHVAFADDMTVLARSWISMKRMLSTLRDALGKRGLTLHPATCQVQTNDVEWRRRGSTHIENGFAVEVIDADSTLTLLGTALSLSDATQNEVNNRIAAGWKTFCGLKRVLVNQKVSIHRRLRLFDSTVGSCVTWCCESWTPRAAELRQLETARHSMLRKIVCSRRGPAEEWLEWISRSIRLGETCWSAGLVQSCCRACCKKQRRLMAVQSDRMAGLGLAATVGRDGSA